MDPVGTVKDNIMNRFMLNERTLEGIKSTLELYGEKMNQKEAYELFREAYYRNMYREHEYRALRAKDVLKDKAALEEVKSIIKR